MWPDIGQEPPHQAGVVRLAQDLLFMTMCFHRYPRSDRCQFFFEKLFLVKVGINAVPDHQRLMRPLFGDPSILEDEDVIRASHS